MAPGSRFKAVQVRGPLGSLFPESQLDIPICYDAFAEAGAILGHGGIVVTMMRRTWSSWHGDPQPLRLASARSLRFLSTLYL